MTRVLVVDGDDAVGAILRYGFAQEGFDTAVIGRGDEAALAILDLRPDIVVTEWQLPGLSGIDLCRRLREDPVTVDLPLIMLTRRGEEADRIRGLDAGADHYVVKPFSMPELIARMHAVMRRAKMTDPTRPFIVGDLELSPVHRRISHAGQHIHLGPTEYRLLSVLMRSPGQAFTREQLRETIWGADATLEIRTVDVHVGRLRKSLNQFTNIDPIRTIRGAGYVFDLSS